jgi:hypothetical protein
LRRRGHSKSIVAGAVVGSQFRLGEMKSLSQLG